MSHTPLRLFATEVAAKKAGLELSSIRGARQATVLYALFPAEQKKPTYLFSSSARLTVPERRWVAEHQATVTKLGRFPVGLGYMPLQLNMVRRKGVQNDDS